MRERDVASRCGEPGSADGPFHPCPTPPEDASEPTVSPERTPAGAGGPDRDTEATRLRFDLAIDAAGIGSFDWDLTSGRLEWDDRLL